MCSKNQAYRFFRLEWRDICNGHFWTFARVWRDCARLLQAKWVFFKKKKKRAWWYLWCDLFVTSIGYYAWVCVCVCFFNILVQTPTSALVSTHCSMQWVHVPVPVLKRSEHEVDQRPSASDEVKNVSGGHKYRDLVLQVGGWVRSSQPVLLTHHMSWDLKNRRTRSGSRLLHHVPHQQLHIISINLHLCLSCLRNSSAALCCNSHQWSTN